MGGAKNHGIVMPDADLDQVVNDLTGAAFGSAGERCMALPVVVPVGEETADRLREKLIPAIDALREGVELEDGIVRVDRFRVVMFPVITGATGEERIYDGYPDVALEMIEHRTFDGRIQLVDYRPRVLEALQHREPS